MTKKLPLVFIVLFSIIAFFFLLPEKKKSSWQGLSLEDQWHQETGLFSFDPKAELSTKIDFRKGLKNDGTIVNRIYHHGPREAQFREEVLWLVLGLRAQFELKNTSLDSAELAKAVDLLKTISQLKPIQNQEVYLFLDTVLDTNLITERSKIIETTPSILETIPKTDDDIRNQAFLLRSYVLTRTINDIEKHKNLSKLIDFTLRNSKIASNPHFTNPNLPGTLVCWDLFQTSSLLKLDQDNSVLEDHYKNSIAKFTYFIKEKPFYFVNLREILPCLEAIIDHDGPEELIESKFFSLILNNYLILLFDFKADGLCAGTNFFMSFPKVIHANICQHNEIHYGYNAWLVDILSRLPKSDIYISHRLASKIGLDTFLEHKKSKVDIKNDSLPNSETSTENENRFNPDDQSVRSEGKLLIENLNILINGKAK